MIKTVTNFCTENKFDIILMESFPMNFFSHLQAHLIGSFIYFGVRFDFCVLHLRENIKYLLFDSRACSCLLRRQIKHFKNTFYQTVSFNGRSIMNEIELCTDI